MTIADMLASWSMKPDCATSGYEALHILTGAQFRGEPPYDLIILDWKMPGLDGIETARRIKDDLRLPKAPTMFMLTAYGGEDLATKVNALGIATLLVKPIEPSTLLDAIAIAFGVSHNRHIVESDGLMQAATPIIRGARILVAEDNEINQLVMLEILEEEGVVCDIAVNGLEAVRLALDPARHYDLVLMDVQMPVVDGLSATREIRRQLGSDKLPIIAVTAHAMEQERVRCEEAGMDDHIPKPVDPIRLMQAISCWVKPADLVGRHVPSRESGNDEALPEALPGFPELNGAIDRVKGNTKLLRRLIFSFSEKYHGFATEFRGLVDAGEMSAARCLAHSLKGGAGTLGATEVAAAASELEAAALDGRVDDVPRLLAAIESCLVPALAVASSLRIESAMSETTGMDGEPQPPVAIDAVEGANSQLQEIGDLLAKKSLDACNRFSVLRPTLAGKGLDDLLRRLGDALEQLDYREARLALDAMVARIDAARATSQNPN
jgi:two-component system sensor histidine kinase/response regulator